MKIIVTGATGHIGSYLIRDLGLQFKESEIVMIDNMMTQRFASLFKLPKVGNYSFIEGDVRLMDLNSLFKGADIVIHLAAITDATGSFDKAMEIEENTGKKLFPRNKRKSEKKVALIGAGPASLACAAYLALEGVEAVIFEKDALPGGLNTTAVAPYKIQTEDSIEEVNWILRHGVELKTGVEIGKDILLEQLIEEYEAVFIGIGLGTGRRLELQGHDSPGVWSATDLIRKIKNDPDFSLPDGLNTVLIIGGGNTAIDISRELAMLGVKDVRLLYRRSRQEMPGYEHEMVEASRYGVRLVENVTPLEIIRNGEKIKSLKVKSTISNDIFDFPCDWVVEAVGQLKHVSDISLEIEVDDQGRVVVDSKTRCTTNPKVYAGGDCINGGKEVVNAVQDGREAAFNILRNLGISPSLHGKKYFKSFVSNNEN